MQQRLAEANEQTQCLLRGIRPVPSHSLSAWKTTTTKVKTPTPCDSISTFFFFWCCSIIFTEPPQGFAAPAATLKAAQGSQEGRWGVVICMRGFSGGGAQRWWGWSWEWHHWMKRMKESETLRAKEDAVDGGSDTRQNSGEATQTKWTVTLLV